MEYQSFDLLLEKFPGNISDFSAAKQGGFRMSLIDLTSNLGYEKVEKMDVDMVMQRTYNFCEVS
jgi:hypothetical protein